MPLDADKFLSLLSLMNPIHSPPSRPADTLHPAVSMSRNISDPDLIDGNSLSSSSNSDFDEDFASQTYPAIAIHEQSMFYPSPLGLPSATNVTLYENIIDTVVMAAAGPQFDVYMDFDTLINEQLVGADASWSLPLLNDMTSNHDLNLSTYTEEK
ncbi:unnamed protein product [Alternaria alternata]